MKTNNKISSFIGGLLMAFSIALFVPTTAQATWNNYTTSTSTTNTQCDIYKEKAQKYLKYYYKCYNYTYYKCYLYYMKKYNLCKSTVPTTIDCNKYKTYADKYLAAYYKCGYYCYYKYYLYYLNLYKKCEANLNQVGKVCGKVFEDTNGNGAFDKYTDKRLANISVKITDAKGKVQTVKTNSYGEYCASDVAEGTATVDIVDSTLPANPSQVVGTDPTTVDVQANTTNWEEYNGYVFPAPTGEVCGKVFEDTNDNGAFDKYTDKRLGNVSVKITDSEGTVQIVKTDDTYGRYCASNVAEGTATVDIIDSTLPANPSQVVGTDPTTVDVQANTNNWEEYNGYVFPTPTGKICGSVFEDTNGNGVQDAGEPVYAGAIVTITDGNGDTQTLTTNTNGEYCADVPAGSTEITVDPTSLPAGSTITTENPTTIDVEAGKKNDAGKDGFEPAPAVGEVHGLVFEDTNGDGVQDAGELPYAGATVTITDVTGDEHNVTTDADGKYSVTGIPEGVATVDVVDSTLPAGSTVTTLDPSDVNVVAGQNNDAGKDGFEPAPTTGKVCGSVFEDTNGNGVQDAYELAYAGATVTITDMNGDEQNVTTDTNGEYCVDVLAGSTEITVDPTSLPTGSTITTENPTTIDVEAGKKNNAGKDGFEPAPAVGTVCGAVLLDGEGEENVTVNIVDVSGETHEANTDANGKYCVPGIPEGDVTVTVDETTLPDGVTQVTGENPNTIPVIANENNNAGIDGYETPTIPGSTCGVVKIDSNENDKFDVSDEGLEGVEVEITDSEGTVHSRTTDANGLWCVNELPEGNATADVVESSLPSGAEQVYGIDPSTVYIIPGVIRTSGADGYILPPECPVNFELLKMEVFTQGMNTADNLQTVLPIDFSDKSFIITFVNVRTGDAGANDQPYEQFKIVAVDQNDNALASTVYTTDIDNTTREDELSNLGTLGAPKTTKNLLLVHRADPVYGENISSGNSVTFKSLCYKIENP